MTASVKGIYRLTIVSLKQFNISSSSSYGVNNVISTIFDAGTPERFTIASTNTNLFKESFTWYFEFVAGMS